MFWKECNKGLFDKHICKPENFFYSNGKNVIYPHSAKTVRKYFEENEKNFHKLKQKLIRNKKNFQYVYASTYPEIYTFVEKRRINLRKNFLLKCKEWRDKKNFIKKQQNNVFLKKIRRQVQIKRNL